MTKNHEQVWKEAVRILQGMLNRELFTRWFKPIKPMGLDRGVLLLGVGNEFYKIWLQDNFLSLIRDAVSQASDEPLQVKFTVAQSLEKPASPTASRPARSKPEPKRTPVASAHELRLNPRNTFSSFIVGPTNNFAHAAAQAVAQSPGKAYNPLFIYGGVGLGKTHLMQAIGHCVAERAHPLRVCYIRSEDFINDFIQAIQTHAMVKFRKKYRHAELLLIDDIHFLAGKERMQEEFFHTFNTLFDAHNQIVLSSDRPAAEIANLEGRLVSRFEWGLVTELNAPELETRLAILRKKAEIMHYQVPDYALEYIAEKIRTNIRRLEGALVRVASYTSLTGKRISQEALERLLQDALHEEAKCMITIDAIQKRVAEHFDIRIADMTSRRQPQNIAFPRQVAMYLSRTLTGRSLSEIGELFGGRDHGTVLHACKLINTRVVKDQQLRQTISYLEHALRRQQHANKW